VVKVLTPIWNEKPETASRVRGRIEAVLDAAKTTGHREGENPARWRGHLDKLFPTKTKVRKVRNHPACVIDDAPTLYSRLAASEGTAAAATRYCMLTAARPGEVTHARWPEIDRAARVWTVPAGRQKSDKPHRVALSDEAMLILDAMWERREGDTGYVFPGGKKGRPLSLTALQKALRVAMGKDLRTDQEGRAATTHGTARSTFDDWGSERTLHPQKLIDRALAHGPKSKTIAAYRRSELLEQRKPLMADWARFLSGAAADNVVPLRVASGDAA
jgi:integrase